MKRLLNRLILAGTCFFMASSGAFAQEEPLKIAILDVQGALFNSARAQEVDQEVKEETAEDEKRIRELASEAQELQSRLEQDAEILSEDERRRLSSQIEEIGVQYQYLVEKLQETVQQRQNEFREETTPVLIQAISEVVEEEGYDLVLRAQATLHFQSSYDITAKVTEKLNSL